MESAEILIPITMFAGVFGVLYVFFTTRHKERIAMIEKGGSADIWQNKSKGYGALKFGMLCSGIAIGIILGYVLQANAGMPEEISMPSMIFLIGGLALIGYYVLIRKITNEA